MSIAHLKSKLAQPIDIAILVYVRMVMGITMLIEVYRYFDHNWIKRYFIDPHFYFTYEGFSWIAPWSGHGMYYHFFILGILAFCISIGFLYRLSSLLFCLGFGYIFLLDKTNYLNHFYLILLLSFIMIFLPANRAFAVDTLIFKSKKTNWAASWTLWWLRLQIGIVYFFGGIAKINSDWLAGEPMRKWLASRTDFPLIGQWFTEEWMVYFFAYSGMCLDLFIVPLLLYHRTRIYATGVVVLFHLMNARLFDIGIFPWFMIALTPIFYNPEKLRFWSYYKNQEPKKATLSRWISSGLVVYFLIQICLPLRHFWYGSNPSWTGQGHRFAWHMKLHRKSAKVDFFITTPQTSQPIPVDLSSFLTKRQQKKLKYKPDMMRQLAAHLAKQMNPAQPEAIGVYVNAQCGLNGRSKSYLINPKVDLSKVSYAVYKKADWIMPLP